MRESSAIAIMWAHIIDVQEEADIHELPYNLYVRERELAGK